MLRLDRPDISAVANRSHARNVHYQGKPVQLLGPREIIESSGHS